MKKRVLEFMDAVSAVMEHALFGLSVWVAIAVLNEMEQQWAIRTVAGLLIIKTYLSPSWENKRQSTPPPASPSQTQP
jgi:hypothetical protein